MTNNRTESGPLEDSSGPIAGDAKDFAIAALEEKVRRLREALKELFGAAHSAIEWDDAAVNRDLDDAMETASAALKDTE